MTEQQEVLKVVLTIRPDLVKIGVQATGCDPFFQFLAGDLAAALAAVPGVVERARQQWAERPRHAQYQRPPTPPPPPRPTPTPPAPRQADPQPRRMF